MNTAESMKNWPRKSVRALGVLVALLGVPDLVYWISILSHNEKLRTAIAEGGPGYVAVELLGSHGAGTIAGLLLGFAFFVAVGVGLWKMKFWGRSGAEALAVLVVMETYREIWFYGPQVHGWLYYMLWMLFVGITFLLLNDSNVRGLFPLPRRAKNLTPRREFLFLMIPIVLSFLMLPASIVYLRIKHRDDIERLTAVPKRMEYAVRDSSYLSDGCEEYVVPGYRIWLPRGLQVVTAGEYPGTQSWWLALVGGDSANLYLMVNLQDLSIVTQAASREQAILGFSSPYELEKILMYPNWSPLYFYWRPILVGDWVEDATGNDWKGFVAGHHLEDKNRYDIEASLYEQDDGGSGCVRMNFSDDYMSPGQAKELLASLRFDGDKESCSQLFSRGKEMMQKGEYAQATALFLTAFREDTLNADYCYHIALSLFDDTRPFRRKMRLRSAVGFLQCVLELGPSRVEMRELLSAAEEELDGLEQENPTE